jgi:xanthine dehydrogenase accessory factor
VITRTKVIEIDPRGQPQQAFGIGERPQRIAQGVLHCISACQ